MYTMCIPIHVMIEVDERDIDCVKFAFTHRYGFFIIDSVENALTLMKFAF